MRCVYTMLIMIAACGASYAQLNTAPVTCTVADLQSVKKGAAFNVDVSFHIKPLWYIYAPTGVNEDQGMIETKVSFTLPQGFVREGKMKLPPTHFKEGFEILDGDNVTLSQTFRASASLPPGMYSIKGKIIWQSCSDHVCLPPVTQNIVTTVSIN